MYVELVVAVVMIAVIWYAKKQGDEVRRKLTSFFINGAFVATDRSAIVVSSVSPDRWEII